MVEYLDVVSALKHRLSTRQRYLKDQEGDVYKMSSIETRLDEIRTIISILSHVEDKGGVPSDDFWQLKSKIVGKTDLEISVAMSAHAVWSAWMQHFLGNYDVSSIPMDTVQRWTRLMNTPFDQLTAEEQFTDFEIGWKHIASLMTYDPLNGSLIANYR